MQGMFVKCNNLTSLDLSSYKPDEKKVTSIGNMFSDCTNLKTIYASSSWELSDSVKNQGAFYGDTALKGGEDTTFSAGNTKAMYARIDTAGTIDTPATPGYFTQKTAPDIVSAAGNNGAAVIASYTSDDDVCTVEKRNDTKWIYTFKNIDTSVQYFAWEDTLENYTSDNMGMSNAVDAGQNAAGNYEVTITNTTTIDPPAYGSLKLTKEVAAGEGTEINDDDKGPFRFIVKLYDQKGASLTGTVMFGNTIFVDGSADVWLNDGESCLMEKIPAGYSYKISEEDNGRFSKKYFEASWTVDPEGTIEGNKTTEVKCTNTKKNVPEKATGYFTLKKIVEKRPEDTAVYTFTVTLSGLEEGDKYTVEKTGTELIKYYRKGEEEITITLKKDETAKVGLPEGASFSITEKGGEYTASYVIEQNGVVIGRDINNDFNTNLATKSVKIDTDNETFVTFTNTWNIRQNVTLKKEVKGGSSASNEAFRFTVYISGLSAHEEIETNGYGSLKADDSGNVKKLEIDLYAGSAVIFYNLPVGATYKFTEAKSDYIASYELTNEGSVTNYVSERAENRNVQTELSTETETVNEGEEVTVTFTNTKVSHDVTVKKAVDMTYGTIPESVYSKKEFKFTVYLTGLTPGAEYTVEHSDISKNLTITAENGVNSFDIYLRDGQSFTIKGLPLNARYMITESAERHYISSYEAAGNTGAVIAKTHDENTKPDTVLKTEKETVDADDHEIVYTFKNTYSASDYELPAAGLPDSRPFTAAVMSGMLLFGAAYLLINRRQKR